MNEDLNQGGIPMFGKNGTALSQAERAEIAKRRGVCLNCGCRTHDVKFMGRKPLTNDDVYQGVCIKCNHSAVPPQISREWLARNAQVSHLQPMNRFRVAANVVRVAHVSPVRQRGPMHPVPQQTSQTMSRGHNSSIHSPSAVSQHDYRRGSHFPLDSSGRTDSVHGSDVGYSLQQNGSNHSHLRAPPPLEQHDYLRGASVQLNLSGRMDSTQGSGVDSFATSNVSSHSQPRAPAQQQQNWSMRSGSNDSTSTNQSDTEDFRGPRGVNSVTVMEELRAQKNQPDVVKHYLHAVRNLTPIDGPMKDLKAIMDMYRGHAKFMMLSVGALWGIASTSKEKKVEAVSIGCLDQIFEMLRGTTTRDDVDTVIWTFGSLSCLARVASNRSVILQKQGVETMLVAIKRHERDPCVFEWGCRALFALVGGFEGFEADGTTKISFEREISKIESDGGIRVIVGTMELHPTDSEALWWALNLLLSMAKEQTDPDRRLIHMMNEEDLASICVKVLKAGVSPECSIRCQEMLLLLLSYDPHQVMQHPPIECIEPVVQGLMEHLQNMSLHEASAIFLGHVAQQDSEAKRRILQGPLVHVMLSSMANVPQNLPLQRAITNLLWTLSSDEESFDYSILRETMQSIKNAIASNPNDKELSTAVSGFVANVAGRARGQPDSIPFDILIPLAKNAGKQGSRALFAVSGCFPEFAELLVSGDAIGQLMEGLSNSSLDIQASSVATLLIVSASDAARTKVIANGGLETASAALLTTKSELLAENLLQLVMTLVISDSKAALEIPNELVTTILQTLKNFPNHTKLCFSTIRNVLLMVVPGVRSVSTDGLVDSILRTIDAPTSPDDEVIEACGALWSFVSSQAPKDTNLLSRIYVSIVRLCQQHSSTDAEYNAPVLAEASGAMAAIMRCIRDCPISIPDADIDLIVGMLDVVIERDVQNVVLMDRFMDVISSLCCSWKEILIQYGVVVVVIDCMVEHEGIESIQEKGCTILASLASTENLQDILSIAETDGIDIIVSAFAGFTENVIIQTDACRALSHLSIDHESRMLISSQGGLMLLANVMNQYRDEVPLLEAASSALLHLSSDADEQILIGSNVVPIVVATLRDHQISPTLHEKCLGVLQNVSMRSSNSKRVIADAGAISAVVYSMREFMGTPSVLERCYSTLRSLAAEQANQRIIAREGAIVMAINGMMACIDSGKVQKQACEYLSVLASADSEHKKAIRDLGGVDAIVYAMWAHNHSDVVLIEACRLFATLAVAAGQGNNNSSNSSEDVLLSISDGEISAILAAMRRFPYSERLQEHACEALRNVLQSKKNVEVVWPQRSDVEQLISAASSRFPERCSHYATQILVCLG